MIEVEQIFALVEEEDGLNDHDHVDQVDRSLEFGSLLFVACQSAHRSVSRSHLAAETIFCCAKRNLKYFEKL